MLKDDWNQMVSDLSVWFRFEHLRNDEELNNLVPRFVTGIPNSWWSVANEIKRDFHFDNSKAWEVLSQIEWKWGKDFSPVELYELVSQAWHEAKRNWGGATVKHI